MDLPHLGREQGLNRFLVQNSARLDGGLEAISTLWGLYILDGHLANVQPMFRGSRGRIGASTPKIHVLALG